MGWNSNYSMLIGYNSTQGTGIGYMVNGSSNLYHPNYNYNAPEQAAAKTWQEIYESRYKYESNGMIYMKGKDGIFRLVGEKPLQTVYPEFEIIMMGRALYNTFSGIISNTASQGEYTYTKTASKHLHEVVRHGEHVGQLSRPYMRSPLTIQEVMSTGKGIPDATFQGGLNWRVPGTFRSSQGIWELGINPNTNVIYHFNFTY